MGAFRANVVRAGRVVRSETAPNILHDQGVDYILRRMFPVGGSFGSARTDWQMGVGGWGCLDKTVTPDGTLDADIPWNRATDYDDVVDLEANEGGAYGDFHRAILGYARKPVSFETEYQGRSAIVRTAEVAFANALTWAPVGSYDPDEFQPPDWSGAQWEPEHGYPWRTPTWKPETWGENGWDDMLTANPHTGATFALGRAFIASVTEPAILLCSAAFTRCLVVRPGDSLFVGYRGRVTP